MKLALLILAAWFTISLLSVAVWCVLILRGSHDIRDTEREMWRH